jgi:membrane dipeptidase
VVRRNDPDHLHHAAIVIDTHCDVTMKILDDPTYDVGTRMNKGHVDLVRMKEGGLDAQFWAVFVYPKQFPGEQGWSRAQEMLDAIHGVVRTYPKRVQLALSAAQIRAAEASGKTALLIGLEGGHALGDFSSEQVVLDRVRQLYKRGVRYMTLTWWRSNPLGGGSGDEEKAGGLTPLGRKVVALMNDLGMIVDVSHSAEPTFYDALKASRLPVLATHSATRSLADHHRNLSDDMLRALSQNGGALCLNFYTGFLDAEWGQRYWKMSKEQRAKVKRPPMSLLADHLGGQGGRHRSCVPGQRL